MKSSITTCMIADNLLILRSSARGILWSMRSENDLRVRSYAAFMITKATPGANSEVM
jgi:hypothetical protein